MHGRGVVGAAVVVVHFGRRTTRAPHIIIINSFVLYTKFIMFIYFELN